MTSLRRLRTSAHLQLISLESTRSCYPCMAQLLCVTHVDDVTQVLSKLDLQYNWWGHGKSHRSHMKKYPKILVLTGCRKFVIVTIWLRCFFFRLPNIVASCQTWLQVDQWPHVVTAWCQRARGENVTPVAFSVMPSILIVKPTQNKWHCLCCAA